MSGVDSGVDEVDEDEVTEVTEAQALTTVIRTLGPKVTIIFRGDEDVFNAKWRRQWRAQVQRWMEEQEWYGSRSRW